MIRLLGAVLMVVAVLGQVGSGARAAGLFDGLSDRRHDAAAARVAALGVICHAGEKSGDRPAPAHRDDCAMCPLCLSLAVSYALLDPPPALPRPRALVARTPRPLPPARAPPAAVAAIAYPRGPPATV